MYLCEDIFIAHAFAYRIRIPGTIGRYLFKRYFLFRVQSIIVDAV